MPKRKKLHPLPQRRGRARSNAPRYPGGKLKPEPITPNPVVVAAREVMLGGVVPTATAVLAENPLDLARHRKWITPAQHSAGARLIELYQMAGMDLPQLRVQDFDRNPKGHTEHTGDAKAMGELRKVAVALRSWPRARDAVFSMCILNEWPAWMIARIHGRPEGPRIVGRVQLVTGLALTGRALGIDGALSLERAA
jgi:hypothetical protein